MKKILLSILLGVFLTTSLSAKEVPSSGEMLVELIVRPISFAGFAVGTGLFLVCSPFIIVSGTTKQTARRLVVSPFLFTFARPFGDYPGYMEELEMVSE